MAATVMSRDNWAVKSKNDHVLRTLCFCVFPARLCCPTFSTRETSNQPFLLFSLPFCWPREATSPGDGAPAWRTPWLLPPKTFHAVVMGNHVPGTAHTWGLPIRDRFRPGNRHRRPQPPSGTCNACKTKVFSAGWCVTKSTFYLNSCARTDWTLLQNSTDNLQKMWQLC